MVVALHRLIARGYHEIQHIWAYIRSISFGDCDDRTNNAIVIYNRIGARTDARARTAAGDFAADNPATHHAATGS